MSNGCSVILRRRRDIRSLSLWEAEESRNERSEWLDEIRRAISERVPELKEEETGVHLDQIA